MAAAASSAYILSHPLFSSFSPSPTPSSKSLTLPPLSSTKIHFSSLTSSSVLQLHFKKTEERWKLLALPENFLISEATPLEDSQLLDSSTSQTSGSYIISALLFVAFIGLSILSIGVIYIAVTDFLTKREKERFEKEEAAKKKKGGKKGKIKTRARAGPRGFGQKVDGEDDSTE